MNNVPEKPASPVVVRKDLPTVTQQSQTPTAPLPLQPLIIQVPSAVPKEEKGIGDAVVGVAAALAWPIAAIVILWMFREPISIFIKKLRLLKGPGVEAATTEELIEKELPNRPAPEDAPPVEPGSSPTETIIISWVAIERAARQAVMRAGLRLPTGASYSTVLRNVQALESADLITADIRPLVADMAKIRNQAIHRPEEPVGIEALERFSFNALYVVAALDSIDRSTTSMGDTSVRA